MRLSSRIKQCKFAQSNPNEKLNKGASVFNALVDESSHPCDHQIASTVKLTNTMPTADVTSMNAACGALTADQVSVQLGNGPISPPPLSDMQSAMTAQRAGMEFKLSSISRTVL